MAVQQNMVIGWSIMRKVGTLSRRKNFEQCSSEYHCLVAASKRKRTCLDFKLLPGPAQILEIDHCSSPELRTRILRGDTFLSLHRIKEIFVGLGCFQAI